MCPHLKLRFWQPTPYSRAAMPSRAGLSLIELMLAVSTMLMIVVALTTMAHGVHAGAEYSNGYGTATQHARVTLDRVSSAVSKTYSCENYPGAWVFADTAGSYTFPDTLVIWWPTTTPANSAGPPLMNELLVFCQDPSDTGTLAEIRCPTDGTPWSAYTNASAMKLQIDKFKTSVGAQKTVVTDLMRVVTLGGLPAGSRTTRPGLRFEVQMTPTLAEMSAYRAGSKTWKSLLWPQGMYGSKTGMRQVSVRTEIQLMPGRVWSANSPGSKTAIPYLGSTAFTTKLTQ